MKAIPTRLRFQHFHIIGKTQTGKTTWMLNLMLSDIKKRRGVGFIDPNGDASRDLLQRIPEERIDDVYYFEPWNYPIGIAPKPRNEREIHLFSNDFISILKRLSDQSWGERMGAILSAALPTLFKTGHGIPDLKLLLVDEAFRNTVLLRLKDKSLLDFWQKVYPKLAKDSPHSILFRVMRFDSPVLFKPFSSSVVSIPQLMDTSKIFIADLSQCDAETKAIYGTILLALFEFGILRRAEQHQHSRTPFFLFVDEFQEFATESFSKIIAQAAKFKVAIHLAHHRLYQTGIPRNVMDDILGVVDNSVVFRVGERETQYFERKFGYQASRTKYAVGVTGSNSLFVPGEGFSPAHLLPYQAIIDTRVKTDTIFTNPLPKVYKDHSHEILARMKKLCTRQKPPEPPRLELGEPEKSPPPKN